MKYALLILLMSLSTLKASEEKPLSMSLSGPQTLMIGENPKFTLKITNTSKSSVSIVRPLDGSYFLWRFPRLKFTADLAGKNYPLNLGGRCGNMNTMSIKDIISIAAGKSHVFNLSWPHSGFNKAGQYKISLAYDLNAPDMAAWRIHGRGNLNSETGTLKSKLTDVIKGSFNSSITIKLLPVNKEKLAQAITSHFTKKGADFAFISKAYQDKKWGIKDIRQSHGFISCSVVFAPKYHVPVKPKHITQDYWFTAGRYIFQQRYNRPINKNSTNIILDRYKVSLPIEAALRAKHFSASMKKELGFPVK